MPLRLGLTNLLDVVARTVVEAWQPLGVVAQVFAANVPQKVALWQSAIRPLHRSVPHEVRIMSGNKSVMLP
jgi:hypothetical protein